jgi:hypothetical protein
MSIAGIATAYRIAHRKYKVTDKPNKTKNNATAYSCHPAIYRKRDDVAHEKRQNIVFDHTLSSGQSSHRYGTPAGRGGIDRTQAGCHDWPAKSK